MGLKPNLFKLRSIYKRLLAFLSISLICLSHFKSSWSQMPRILAQFTKLRGTSSIDKVGVVGFYIKHTWSPWHLDGLSVKLLFFDQSTKLSKSSWRVLLAKFETFEAKVKSSTYFHIWDLFPQNERQVARFHLKVISRFIVFRL